MSLQSNMKIRNYLFICLLFISTKQIFSQTNSDKLSLEEKLDGTYVLIQSNLKITELTTTDVLIEVEKRREKSKDVYYQVSENLTIRILPWDVIKAVDFDPKKYQ